MNNMMTFPKTIDEFIDLYQFVDRKEVYTNGSELIQVFRVQQALDHYLPKWISVKERLPEMGQTVVCAVYGTDLVEQEDGETFVDALRRNRKHAHIELGYLAEDGWNEWEGYPMIVSPSYWMLFPDIPMPEVEG